MEAGRIGERQEKPSHEKEAKGTLRRLPLVGDPLRWTTRPKIVVDTERPSHGSRDRQEAVGRAFHAGHQTSEAVLELQKAKGTEHTRA